MSKFSFKYTLRDEHNVNVCVCQKGFCHVLGFGPKRIQVLRKKLNAGEVQPDQRGKHGNHQSISEDTKEKIRAHIYHTQPDIAIIQGRTILIEFTFLLSYPSHGSIEHFWNSMILSICNLKRRMENCVWHTNQ